MSGYEGVSKAVKFILPYSGRRSIYYLMRFPFWRIINYNKNIVFRSAPLLVRLAKRPYWAIAHFEFALYKTLTQGEILRG